MKSAVFPGAHLCDQIGTDEVFGNQKFVYVSFKAPTRKMKPVPSFQSEGSSSGMLERFWYFVVPVIALTVILLISRRRGARP